MYNMLHVNSDCSNHFFFSMEYRLPAGLAISARKVSKSDTILVNLFRLASNTQLAGKGVNQRW